MQEKHKFVTILVLIGFAFVLLFSFSKLQTSNNLNANNTNNNGNNTNPPFTYQTARASLNSNVEFENNFGGSNNDTVMHVVNLDYYYIIGNTTSTDYYFAGNSTQNVFVIKMSRSGNVVNLNVTSLNNLQFVSCFTTSFGITVLCKNTNTNATVVCYYNFSTTSFTYLFEVNNLQPFMVCNANNLLCVVGSENGKLVICRYNHQTGEITLQTTQIAVTNVLLFTEYENGILCFLNNQNGFSIYTITQSNYQLKHHTEGYNLHKFSICSNGYFLLLTNQSGFCFNTLSTTFLLVNTVSKTVSASDYQLQQTGNNCYLFYKLQTNALFALLFSCGGDLVFEHTLSYQCNSLQLLTQKNGVLLLALKTTENNLQLITLTQMFQAVNNYILPFGSHDTLLTTQTNYDGNFMLFGNSTANTGTVTNNYGESDVFTIKVLNL